MSQASGVHVVDVGHGSCLAIVENDQAVLIDTGQGNSTLEFLTKAGVRHIPLVILSHADEDHIGGMIGLLEPNEFTFGEVRVNSDAKKSTKVWKELLHALEERHEAGALRLKIGLARGDEFPAPLGICLRVVAPRLGLAATGPGSAVATGRRASANTASAVIMITRDNESLVLVSGDLDAAGLKHLLAISGPGELNAPILVYPHHGGRASTTAGNEAAFVSDLCAASMPEIVVFSNGRVKKSLRQETVAAVRASLPSARLSCTQLSPLCAETLPPLEPGHLLPLHARGRLRRECCGGTMTLLTADGELQLKPSHDSHQEFIATSAPTALCMASP